MAMVIEELSTRDDVIGLEPIWNNVLAASGSETAFLTHEWVVAYLRWIAGDATPMVLVARDGNDVIGIAPLLLARRSADGRTVRRVEFIGVPNSDYSDFIVTGDRQPVLQAFFRHLLSRRRAWDEALLTEIPEGSETIEATRAIFARPWVPGVVLPGEECPTLMIEGHEQEILDTLARKKYIGKRDLQKTLDYIGTHGKLTFRHAETLDDGERLLPHLFRLHRARWADTPTPSKFENPNYERFYTELLTALWPHERVAVTAMELDSQPMAVSFAFPFGRTWINHNWAYDYDFSKFSPGSLLIQFMISDAIAQGFREFDFTRGAEPYKDRFKNHVKHNSNVLVYGDNRTYARDLTRSTMAKAKRRVTEGHPGVHEALRKAKRTVRRRP